MGKGVQVHAELLGSLVAEGWGLWRWARRATHDMTSDEALGDGEMKNVLPRRQSNPQSALAEAVPAPSRFDGLKPRFEAINGHLGSRFGLYLAR